MIKMGEFLRVNSESDRNEAVQLAASILKGGGLVAFPTETVYGIGVHMKDPMAVTRLYRLKGRPNDKPMTLHISMLNDLDRYGIQATPEEYRLMKEFWPGPLTLILRNKKGERVGVRWPRHDIACRIIQQAALPIGCPSANLSGEPAPTTADAVVKGIRAEIDLIVDGGATELGTSSTVAAVEGKSLKVLREGALSTEVLMTQWKT